MLHRFLSPASYRLFGLTGMTLVGSMVGMRKALLAVAVLLFLPVSGVFALSATRSAEVRERAAQRRATLEERLEERREAIQARIETRQEQLATRAAEIRQRVAEHRKTLIRRFFKRMLRRFQAAIERMRRLAERIEGRLNKMEARGIDVADLRADLAEVRADLDVAAGLLNGLETTLEEALVSDDPKAAFESVRETIQETRRMLVDLHLRLVAIITQMKAIHVPESEEATDSATPSAT